MPSSNPETTLVVVLGASEWPFAPKLPMSSAFRDAASAVVDYFKNPALFGLPNDDDHLLNLFDSPDSPNEINRILTHWLRAAQSKAKAKGASICDLIMYYVGHGGFTPGEQAYYLALRATEEDNEGISSLRMTDLARTVKREAKSLRRFLILDCCFAESAYGIFMTGEGNLADAAHAKSLVDFPESGTALLCSSSARDVSLAPKGERYTMFSGCLLEVLEQGAPTIGLSMSLEQVGKEVASRINKRYKDLQVRPKVSAPDESEGDIAGFPLFPNLAVTSSTRNTTSVSTIADRRELQPARQPFSTPTTVSRFRWIGVLAITLIVLGLSIPYAIWRFRAYEAHERAQSEAGAASHASVLTSSLLKASVRWYAAIPIFDPNADDPKKMSLHSLWLDLNSGLLSQISSARWVIHDSNLKKTVSRKDNEHLEFTFDAYGCWDVVTVTVEFLDKRPPVVADFNECNAQKASRPGN